MCCNFNPMYKTVYTFLVCVWLVLAASVSFAQEFEGKDNDFGLEEGEEEEAEQKVVESKIALWKLSGYSAFVDSMELDTTQDYKHIYHPLFKNALTATYVGNYSTPGMDNNFFNRNYSTSYYFAQTREAYYYSPDRLEFYNTTTPYTLLDFSQSENKSKNNETRFNVIHSRNINPFWNFTFKTRQEKSAGQYNAQESKNSATTLYTTYNRDNWNVYGGFLSNKIENGENGGIVSDSLLENGSTPNFWATRLVESQSNFGYTSYFGTGEYRIGKWTENDSIDIFHPVLGVIYSFQYDRNKQEFTDKEDIDNDFFENTYYGDAYTKDSIRFNRLSNVVQLKQYESAQKKYTFGKRAFLGHEISRGSMPGTQVNDSTHIRSSVKYSNLYVGGGIFREKGRFWTWNFDGRVFLAGRSAGQFDINGEIQKPFVFGGDSAAFIKFYGTIENRVADYFQEYFRSNHYRWDNNFDMEQRMTLGGTLKLPKRHFEVGANYAIINNFVYTDTLGIPNQTTNELLVLSAWLDKDFVLRNLHFRTRLLWQSVSDDTYLHLPDMSAFVSTYYQFVISKVLFTQLGADARYNTMYYADAYAPSTGLFYLQNEKQYGNYPYIDVYASVRLKRTRVFFKWMNIGTNFLSGTYMTTPHYPMNRATFRLGVSWSFYD